MSLLAMAKSTAVKNCLLSFMSDWMVGKLGAPANANIVVLKAEKRSYYKINNEWNCKQLTSYCNNLVFFLLQYF
jgi:hypothetical protein